MNQKPFFEKVQNFDENTTEYVNYTGLTPEELKSVEERIIQRYNASPDFSGKLERLPSENGGMRLRIRTEPESLVYVKTGKDLSFVIECEDFDVKWHVSNILQMALALAGYEIKDTKF